MDSPDPPDYSAQLNTQNQITDRQMSLAERAYDDQSAMVAKFLPLFEQQAQLNVANQADSKARSDTQWSNYTDNFLPLEQKFAQQAADYNTDGRQRQEADRAAAGVAAQFDTERARLAEESAAAGVMPGSGRSMALSQALSIEEAKAKAGAADSARQATEAKGLSLMNSAIGVGRGQVSGGLQAADLAMRQGNSAQGSATGAIGTSAQPYTLASGIYGNAGSSNQGAAGIVGAQYQGQLAASNQSNALFGDLLGAGLSAAGMFMSSEEFKDVGPEVAGASDAIEASPAKHWKYRMSLADAGLDQKPRMGPTAESLRDATGGVVSDGRQVDAVAMLGLHHAALDEQAKRIARVERTLGLADARPKVPAKKAGGTKSLSDALEVA